jgi:hypothetical protein
LKTTSVHTDVAAKTVENVDSLGVVEFPRTSTEGVWLGGKGSDRAEIDHIARKFGVEGGFEVSSDLDVVATTSAYRML